MYKTCYESYDKDIFDFIGRSNLLLFPYVYFVLGGGTIVTIFVTVIVHILDGSYLKGCNLFFFLF